MARTRRGGYVFVTWVGDHGNHVHVYRDGRLIVKWNLDHDCVEGGSRRVARKVIRLIRELRREGKLRYESKES